MMVFKIVYNCCYPNCCRTNCVDFENKPAAQAAGANPSLCNRLRQFWVSTMAKLELLGF